MAESTLGTLLLNTDVLAPTPEIALTASLLSPDQQDEYDKAVALIQATIEELSEEEPPAITVEGLSVVGATSPSTVISQTAAQTVSIFGDASMTAIADYAKKSVSGPKPEMITVAKLLSVSPDVASEICRLNQAERKIIEEVIDSGLEALKSSDDTETFSEVESEYEESINLTLKKIDVLGNMLTQADVAATGLNIKQIQDQIMSMAATNLADILQTTDGGNDVLGTSISDFVAKYYSNNLSEDVNYSSSSIVLNLATSLFRACESQSPVSLGSSSNKKSDDQTTNATVRFVKLSEVPTITANGSTQTLPKNRDMCRPHEYSILSTLKRDYLSKKRPSGGGQLNRNRPEIRINHGSGAKWADILSEVPVQPKDLETIKKSIISQVICISNEFITSAGIGRLVGSSLGDRFLVAVSPETGINQYEPYSKLLGESPFAERSTLERFYLPVSRGYEGGLTDYLALGEEVPESEVTIIPLENNSASVDGHYYLSGKKYFIDLGLENITESDISKNARIGLVNYSESLTSFFADSSSYLNELLAFDQSTGLSPEIILARILKDFSTVLSNVNKDSTARDPKSDVVAGMFASCGNGIGSAEYSQGSTLKVSASQISLMDYLSAITLATLQEYDERIEDSTFKLSGEKTVITYEKEGDDGELEYDPASIGAHIDLANAAISQLPTTNSTRTSIFHIGANVDKWTGVNSSYGGVTELLVGRTDETTFRMHDTSFSGGYNLLNMIAATCREIQYQALTLAKRDGADSDYRSDGGKTLYSGMDDDRFVRLMVEIYANIASLVLPVRTFSKRNPDENTYQNDQHRGGIMYGIVSQNTATASQAIVDSLITSLTNGQQINSDIYEKAGVAQSTSLNTLKVPGQTGLVNYVVKYSKGSDRLEYTIDEQRTSAEASEIVEVAESVQRHRYSIKAAAKIFEQFPAAVSSAASGIASTFSILNGDNIVVEDLSEDEKVLYDMYSATNYQDGTSFLGPITPHQISLKKAAYLNFLREDDDSEFPMKTAISPTKFERDATLDYLKHLYETINIDDSYIVSVGLPQGIISAVQRPFTSISANHFLDPLANLGTDLTIEMYRFDEAHGDVIGAGQTIDYAHTIPIDPEIFILPGSIKYVPEVDASGGPLENIHISTTYYRIQNGVITEEIQGTKENLGNPHLTTCLKSYLLDLIQYELLRFRLYDFLDNTPPVITTSAYNFLKTVSDNSDKSKTVLCKPGFIDLFQPTNRMGGGYSLLQNNALINALAPDSLGVRKHYKSDVVQASYLNCFPKLISSAGVLSKRSFDRVYTFLYDEKLKREELWDYDMVGIAATENSNSVTRGAMREEFDMFSLAVYLRATTED